MKAIYRGGTADAANVMHITQICRRADVHVWTVEHVEHASDGHRVKRRQV
ncbi:MAG TPA: hypothetical protein VFH51_17730 [Myxococcota bacterium]|nr:hypothetical protein [Myxococcota bacterium]